MAKRDIIAQGKIYSYNPVKAFDLLWERAIGGVALLAHDGTFIKVNPAFCKIVEYTEQELQMKTYSDITASQDAEIDRGLAKEVADGTRNEYDMIKSYETKTRRLVWVHLRVTKLVDEETGEFQMFLSQIFEIPVSVVSRMGYDIYAPPSSPPPPKTIHINWDKIAQYTPLIAFALGGLLIGIGWFLGLVLGPPTGQDYRERPRIESVQE